MTPTVGWSRLEQRIGRRLTAAEHHIAVEEIDDLLNRAKDELEQAIRDEQARYAHAKARGHAARLEVTQPMVEILRRIRDAGATHAELELVSMGHLPRRRRAHAADDTPKRPPQTKPLSDYVAILRARLHTLTIKIKIETSALAVDMTDVTTSAFERAAMKVLGARGIAADLVSPTFTSGLSETFEQHLDLVDRWQYTAVNDAGLCDVCAPHDGEIFDTLDDLFTVLPGFGPNPDCLGGSRCRCRAVPVPPDTDG